jgi:hypothetical protein
MHVLYQSVVLVHQPRGWGSAARKQLSLFLMHSFSAVRPRAWPFILMHVSIVCIRTTKLVHLIKPHNAPGTATAKALRNAVLGVKSGSPNPWVCLYTQMYTCWTAWLHGQPTYSTRRTAGRSWSSFALRCDVGQGQCPYTCVRAVRQLGSSVTCCTTHVQHAPSLCGFVLIPHSWPWSCRF